MGEGSVLRESVRMAYSAIAEHPEAATPFPTGRELALNLGYPSDLLNTLPSVAVDAFCGVSNVPLFADIPVRATVLDLGCGAGLDTLITGRRTGKGGKVIGIDFSVTMLARARQATDEAGADNVGLLLSSAESLPLESDSIDVALVNGIFNLNPARERIFGELARVLRTGGAVYVAELILNEFAPEAQMLGATEWFS